MDPDLIDPHLVFARTASGEEAMLQRTRVVQRNIRMVLILVDGNATVTELCDKTGNAQITQNALLELESDGFIERRVEKDSVWRHARNAANGTKTATLEPASEFSTFGHKAESLPAESAFSRSQVTRIIPFPESRQSRPSLTPSTLTPSTLAPTTLTPAPTATASDYGTVFLPKAAPESSAALPADTPHRKPSLLERLKALAKRSPAEELAKPKFRRRGGQRLDLTWPMGLLLGLLLFSAILALAVLLFPYTRYLPEVEAVLAQSTGRTARVGAMRVSVYPRPGLLLDSVRFGDEADSDAMEIPALRLQPVIGTLLSPKVIFREAELSEISLSAETMASLSRMLQSAARPSATAGVLHVSVVNAELSFSGLRIAGMSGDLELSGERRLEAASLRSADGKLSVQLRPTTSGVAVQLEGLGWRPAHESPYVFDSLDLKGEISGPDFVINSVESRIFDGLVRGTTVLRGSERPTMAGEISFERINVTRFGEALGIGRQFEGEARGKLKFSASADSWSVMLPALQATGDFTIQRGSLGGIDLPEAVRRVSAAPLTLGGRTRFEELSGVISLTPGAWRFSRLVLNAGLMHSSGQIEVSRDLQLRGRMDVQMRGRADHTAMPILISGPLKSPLTQTAGH
jgi:hypothetical protein